MKKSIFRSILCISIFILSSCTSNEKQEAIDSDPIVITGKITAHTDAVMMLLAGDYSNSIKIAADGTFRDTLIAEEGFYRLIHNKENTNIYLSPGMDLHIELNNMQFDESLIYSEEGAGPNSYLAAKKLKNEEERKTFDVAAFYSSEEAEYASQMNVLYQEDLAFLNTYVDLPQSFLEWEKLDIEYGKLLSVVSYKNGHEYFTKKTDFQPSTEFMQALNDLDKDNDEYFKNLENYRNVLVNHYSLIARDTKNFEQISKIVSELKSPLIKEAVMNDLSFQVSPSNENLTKLVELLNAHSTDPEFKERINTKYNSVKKLAKGMPSPKFNYENVNGKMVSLDGLKGKLVYIDVWATWCGPCKREIPYLKEVETKYHGQPIEFVSVSIDKQSDKQKWLNMVSEKELGGIQVLADNDWSSTFVKNYSITGIPRFLLIDKEGNIINADAPRPSNPELEQLLAEYLKS